MSKIDFDCDKDRFHWHDQLIILMGIASGSIVVQVPIASVLRLIRMRRPEATARRLNRSVGTFSFGLFELLMRKESWWLSLMWSPYKTVRLMVDSMWEDMNDGNVGRLESRWPIQKSSWHVSILTQCGKKCDTAREDFALSLGNQ